MSKTVTHSKFQEWRGLDRISLVVHEMKCIFREITKDDYGIDGEIEVVEEKPDGSGYQTTGGVIKVQAKSGMTWVKHDTETSFYAPIAKDDLEVWHRSPYPVILVVYHPEDDKLYWREIKSYVESTPNVWQPPHRVSFDKVADEFSPTCFQRIRSLAPRTDTTRISFTEQERLISNLLRVKKKPRVWSARCMVKHHDEVRSGLQGFVPPYFVTTGRIYSLSNLRAENCVLRDFYDATTVRSERLDDWLDDVAAEQNYVFMLNQLLGSHLHRRGIRYNKRFKRDYFPRENDADTEFGTAWQNIRTGKSVGNRTTVKFYEYGRDRFWRHIAAEFSFRRMGIGWFLEIVPKYLFTEDGETPWASDRVGEYTTRIKARETNQHVLNHVLFWADVLSVRGTGQSNPSEIAFILDSRIVMVIEKMPVAGIAPFGIPFDPASYEEPSLTGQISFLEWLDESNETDDDD